MIKFLPTFIILALCPGAVASAQTTKVPAVIEDCQVTETDSGSEKEIIKKLRGRRDAFLDCYLKEKKLHPNLEGHVDFTFRVTPLGGVYDLQLDSNTVADSLVSRCIGSRLKGIRLDTGQSDTTTVRIRFRFDRRQKDNRSNEPGLLYKEDNFHFF